MKILKYIISFFFIFSSSVFAAEGPDKFLENSVKEISAFISENKEILDTDERFLRSKVHELVIPKLDIELMSKIILGKKNWTSMSPDLRNRFIIGQGPKYPYNNKGGSETVKLTIDNPSYTEELMDKLMAKKRYTDRKQWLEEKGNLAEL